MLRASIPVVVAAAMADPSMSFAQWVPVLNSRLLPSMRWGRVRDPAPKNQAADPVWYARRGSASSRNACFRRLRMLSVLVYFSLLHRLLRGQ